MIGRVLDLVETLEARAENTPDAAVRATLIAARERHSEQRSRLVVRKPPRADEPEKTPQSEMRAPLVQALQEAGGKGRTADIIDRVGNIMAGTLKPGDFELVSSGDERWRNSVQWVRLQLVKEGVMKDDSPKGIWELREDYMNAGATDV